MTHIVENIFYNELIVRRCSVDFRTVCTPEGNTSGNPAQTPREIDFIASKGGKKVYIQSACAMETEEKIAAENKPLSLTGDSFPGIIVRHDMRKRRYDESGVLNIDIIDFLPDDRLFQNTMDQLIPGIGDKK